MVYCHEDFDRIAYSRANIATMIFLSLGNWAESYSCAEPDDFRKTDNWFAFASSIAKHTRNLETSQIC